MTLRLYDSDFNQVLVEKEYPGLDFASGQDPIQECSTLLDHPLGQGTYREVHFEGVHIGYGDAFLSNRVQLNFESDLETIEMHFALKGQSSARSESFERAVAFSSNQHNIVYAKGMNGELAWESEHFQLCEINLTPSFFCKFLPEDHQLFELFRQKIGSGKSALMNAQHCPISPEMYRIIHEIITCDRTGLYKRMFLEAKVIELLLLQLEQFVDQDSLRITIRRSDLEKIHAVRDYMLKNLDSQLSLVDLAHEVGTNEFMLKKGFKEVFGTTVFGFWSDAKMQQAKLLLEDQRISVTEVSQLIGYKNPRHFSAAFKRKFGFVPSQLRRN